MIKNSDISQISYVVNIKWKNYFPYPIRSYESMKDAKVPFFIINLYFVVQPIVRLQKCKKS